MRELLSVAIKQEKKITLFFVDETELDEITATENSKIFGNCDILSVTRCDDPTKNFVINLSLVKYFTASQSHGLPSLVRVHFLVIISIILGNTNLSTLSD